MRCADTMIAAWVLLLMVQVYRDQGRHTHGRLHPSRHSCPLAIAMPSFANALPIRIRWPCTTTSRCLALCVGVCVGVRARVCACPVCVRVRIISLSPVRTDFLRPLTLRSNSHRNAGVLGTEWRRG